METIIYDDRFPYLDTRAIILAFLNEAEKDGWVMVPRDAGETMLEAGRKAWKAKRLHVSHAASDDFMTCGVIYRAMVKEGSLPLPRMPGADQGTSSRKGASGIDASSSTPSGQ